MKFLSIILPVLVSALFLYSGFTYDMDHSGLWILAAIGVLSSFAVLNKAKSTPVRVGAIIVLIIVNYNAIFGLGMLGAETLGVLAAVITITAIILAQISYRKWKEAERKKAIADFENGGEYRVAMQIKEALTQNGYSIGELSMKGEYIKDNNAWVITGTLYIPSKGADPSGEMRFSNKKSGLDFAVYSLQAANIKSIVFAKKGVRHEGYRYAIHNDNIGLLISSNSGSQEVPQFLEIAASVMKSSAYEFHHPKWMDSDSQRYLNTMFQ